MRKKYRLKEDQLELIKMKYEEEQGSWKQKEE